MNVLFYALVTLGCGGATETTGASSPADEAPIEASIGQEAFGELIRSGAEGTTRALGVVEWYVSGATEAERIEARASADVLMGACPYNRASVQLALVTQKVVSRHAAATERPEVQAEWHRIQDGLARHVSLLDGFGVTGLRAPIQGEYLFDHPDVVVTRAQLDASDDPIALSATIVARTPELVERYDLATRQFIDAAQVTLSDYSAGHWPLSPYLGGWQIALEALEPQLVDPAMKADVQALLELLRPYANQRC
jgi:hypothetical protein